MNTRSAQAYLVLIVFGTALSGQTPQPLTIVSAANYGVQVTPASIVSIFASSYNSGPDASTFTSSTFTASDQTTVPQTTSLGGVSATLIFGSTTYALPLIAVTPSVVNAVLPPLPPALVGNTLATINITNGSGVQFSGEAYLAAVAPALFTADQSGTWLPAAQIVIQHANGTQTVNSVASYTSTLTWNGLTWSNWVPIPISLGSGSDQAVLVLYGTGISGTNSIPISPLVGSATSALSLASLIVGSSASPIQFIGPQPSFYGLDQVNVALPHYLAGSGVVPVTLGVYAGGNQESESNTVYLDIQ